MLAPELEIALQSADRDFILQAEKKMIDMVREGTPLTRQHFRPYR